jgi:hypothetical protein
VHTENEDGVIEIIDDSEEGGGEGRGRGRREIGMCDGV